MADKRKVTLAYPWTDQDGREHNPDTVVSVDDVTGRDLIRAGLACPASDESVRAGAKDTTQPAPATATTSSEKGA